MHRDKYVRFRRISLRRLAAMMDVILNRFATLEQRASKLAWVISARRPRAPDAGPAHVRAYRLYQQLARVPELWRCRRQNGRVMSSSTDVCNWVPDRGAKVFKSGKIYPLLCFRFWPKCSRCQCMVWRSRSCSFAKPVRRKSVSSPREIIP